MKSFSDLNRHSMDLLADKINPLIATGMIGHLWTSRFELACIIERIEDWIETDAIDMFEIQQARELATFFRTLFPQTDHLQLAPPGALAVPHSPFIRLPSTIMGFCRTRLSCPVQRFLLSGTRKDREPWDTRRLCARLSDSHVESNRTNKGDIRHENNHRRLAHGQFVQRSAAGNRRYRVEAD